MLEIKSQHLTWGGAAAHLKSNVYSYISQFLMNFQDMLSVVLKLETFIFGYFNITSVQYFCWILSLLMNWALVIIFQTN